MKKIIIISLAFLTITISNAQVFNTATTLKKGAFALGVEPVIYTSSDDFLLFVHGGYGIKKGLDFGLKAGLGGGDTYFGADLEFSLRKNISLAVGAHNYFDLGLDGTLLFNIPIRKDIKFITGVDADIIFSDDSQVPIWIPLGLEVMLRSKMALHFETEISVNDYTHILGGGLNFFF